MTKKVCVFDFDGVIASSREVGYAMHNNVKDKYGLPQIQTNEDYLRIIDDGSLKNILEQEKITNYYLDCNSYYATKLSNIKLFPAIKKLLQESPEEIIIISSSPDSFIKQILQSNGISKYTVYGKETAKTKKERFELLLNQKKLSKDDIIYIGDTIDDYHFCEKVGIPMIGSNYGYSNLDGIKDLLYGLALNDEELVETIKPLMLVR